MALLNHQHQLQGSLATFPRFLSWSKGVDFKQKATTICMIGRENACSPVKHNLKLSIDACTHRPNSKLVKLFPFEGGIARPNASGGSLNGSKISKKVAYVLKESGEAVIHSPTDHSLSVSYTSETNERTLGRYIAVLRQFQKWLNVLKRHPSSQTVNGIMEGASSSQDLQETYYTTSQNDTRSGILKKIWLHFLKLDATVKTSILIFIPLYVAVSLIHGAEVTKDLTPLWILGPFCIAFYVKMAQLMWTLYVFSYKQMVKVIKNLPWFYQVAYGYVEEGKFKDDICTYIFRPNVKFKNLDHGAVFEEWLMEKYLDVLESIWPYYCRTIRFLKMANLMKS